MDKEAPVLATRLDAFVDAAFAFAVTLLVIGGGAVPASYAQLESAVANAPAFLIGFALIALFWHAHVRWRGYGTREGTLPVLLSLLIVFLVLVYVYPLRLMATSLAEYVSGNVRTMRSPAEVKNLFALYGLGFMAMALAIVALFATSLRADMPPERRAGVTAEIGIWTIHATAGLLSALLSRIGPVLAPWVYSLLPIAIPLFVVFHKRRLARAGEPSAGRPPGEAGR